MIYRIVFDMPPIGMPPLSLGLSQRVPRMVCDGKHPRFAVRPLPHIDPEALPDAVQKAIVRANSHFESTMLEFWKADNIVDDELLLRTERAAALDPQSFRTIVAAIANHLEPVDPSFVRPGARLGRVTYASPLSLPSNRIFDADLSGNGMIVSSRVANQMSDYGIEGIKFVQIATPDRSTVWFEVDVLGIVSLPPTVLRPFKCTLCGQAGSSGAITLNASIINEVPDLFRIWGRAELYCSRRFAELLSSRGWYGVQLVAQSSV